MNDIPPEVKEFLSKSGRKGGLATKNKYSKDIRVKWGSKGGRPKKNG